MVALVENPLRYTAEARLLRQAMEGDYEAANRVLLYWRACVKVYLDRGE